MILIESLFQYSFFTNAIGVSLILSLLFTLISFLIVTKKLSFLAIGTEHATFGGMGLAHFMSWDPLITTMIFCSLITVFAGRSHKKSSELGISLLFSASMALGLILLSFANKNAFNLKAFLFGDLMAISYQELQTALIVVILVIILIVPNLNKILFIIFDRDAAFVSGISVDFWNTVLYIILSVSIILGIRLVGVLLVAAMTVLPAAFALLWQKNMRYSLIIALVFTTISMLGGVFLSFYWDIVPGALIVTLATVGYFIAKLFCKNKI
ncbi:MAG: metal ABC transporter permease [Brevinema sp.]